MKRHLRWIGSLVIIITLSGVTRFKARHAYAAGNIEDSLTAPLAQSLKAAGYEALTDITLTETNGKIMGYSFQGPQCSIPVKIIESSITLLHHGEAKAYLTPEEDYYFLYQGFKHTGSSRAILTARWLLNNMRFSLGLLRYRRSKLQLIISNPSGCDITNIVLDDVWSKTLSTKKGR